MTLLENWRNKAYGDATDNKQKEEIWKITSWLKRVYMRVY